MLGGKALVNKLNCSEKIRCLRQVSKDIRIICVNGRTDFGKQKFVQIMLKL
jgi:hypothetical protein